MNEGNVNKAQSCFAPDFRPTQLYPLSSFHSSKIDSDTIDRKSKECFKFLAGNIQEVEIEAKRIVKEFGSTRAGVIVRVVLRPGVMERFKKKEREIEEEIDKAIWNRRGVNVEELLLQRSMIWFITDLPERQHFILDKWNGKWKIVGWQEP